VTSFDANPDIELRSFRCSDCGETQNVSRPGIEASERVVVRCQGDCGERTLHEATESNQW
jgi:DNA-directed RNA polymerase subunit RPC12/RpoP